MSSFIFTTSLWVQLGLPHPGLLRQSSCVCGHPLDLVGTHILRCSHGSERTSTHHDIWDVLAAIAQDTGYHVTTEQTHVLLTVDGIPDRRHANIVFSQAGVGALVDVVVADPMGASMVLSVAHIPGHAASSPRHSGDLIILSLCSRGFWGSSLGPGPVPLVHGSSLCGVATVPPSLDGYGLS
ncbi:unnamed protein product [Calypogeia fissa]